MYRYYRTYRGAAISFFSFILLFGLGCNNTPNSQINLDGCSTLAAEILTGSQKQNGAWKTYINYSNTPKNLKTDVVNVYTGMIIVDLIKPVTGHGFQFDSLIRSTLAYTRSKLDDQTGLLRFYDKFVDLPEDADDTGLFWMLNEENDSLMVQVVLDTLEKIRAHNGMYHTWFRPGGIPRKLGAGRNPNPTDFMTNIHLYLFLKKYRPAMADTLCQTMKRLKVNRKQKFWVYNKNCPWLYFIRQVDLANNCCSFNGMPKKKVEAVADQEVYTEMARLVRDLALNHADESELKLAHDILTEVAAGDFKMIRDVPILVYHNDLSFRRPSRFWSYDVPYALWLRLFFEYKKYKN